MNKNISCFLSGSHGFIGKHLLPRLLEKGYTVDEYNTDSNISQFLDKEYDCVIHLAGITEHDVISKDPESFREKTINLLQKILQIKTRKFIFPSSGKVYGGDIDLSEDMPTLPRSTLGNVKLACEHIIKCRQGENYILRLFNVYGQGQKDSFLIPTILEQMKYGNVVKLGDVGFGRDYIYIEDVINLLLKIIECQATSGNYIYNVSTGISTTAEEMAYRIADILNIETKVVVDKERIRNDGYHEAGNSYRAAIDFEWKILYNVREGLIDLLKKEGML